MKAGAKGGATTSEQLLFERSGNQGEPQSMPGRGGLISQAPVAR
jgi:hypothetical protein